MSRLFNAEPGVYPGHEYHELSEAEIMETRDLLEEQGSGVDCSIIDDIIASRARQAVRYYARRIVDRGAAEGPKPAPAALREYPTLHSGHFSNMIGEVLEDFGWYRDERVTGARLYISRMTVRDGAPCDRCLEVEFRTKGAWKCVCPENL